MLYKPTPESILEHYSLSDLLELVQKKSDLMVEERLQQAREHLAALTNMVSPGSGASYSSPFTTSESIASEPSRSMGAPSPLVEEDRPRRKYTKRDDRKKSLKDHLLEVMTPQPMNVNEILRALKANGFKSKADDPRRILYLELSRQVKEGALVKVSRGEYALKA